MTLLDDWPSLAPIRTSSNSCRDSRVCCETLQPSDDPKFFHQHPLPSSDPSPPSTSSSALDSHLSDNYFSSSSDATRFRSCFPPKLAPNFSAKPTMSPGREGIRRGSSDMFRSFVGFSGPIHHSGSMAHHPGARSHSGPLKLSGGTINTGHSGMLKGYSAKGHAGNAFTMIPADVVGKKKPPGYESDEPTSPEVTCIGRVRRKKHCKAWDALVVNEKGRGNRNAKISSRSTESPRKDKQNESPSKAAKPSRWRLAWGLKNTAELDNADLQKQSNMVDNLYIDLGRFSSACELSSRVIPGFDDSPADELKEFQVPPSNCLLVMKNTSKGRYNYEDLLQPASTFCSTNPHKDSILWKRNCKSELSNLASSTELQLQFQPKQQNLL